MVFYIIEEEYSNGVQTFIATNKSVTDDIIAKLKQMQKEQGEKRKIRKRVVTFSALSIFSEDTMSSIAINQIKGDRWI